MYIDFSKLFHRASKSKNDGSANIFTDVSKWPKAWKTIFYKTYELLPSHILSRKVPERDPGLFATITERKSGRSFAPVPITTEELSTLLLYSCGEIVQDDSSTRRAQPSGGPRYPVEAYVLALRSSDDLSAGVYHYNVQNHTLECINAREFSREDIGSLFMYPWVQDAAAVVILTGVFSRTKIKYGQRGYRYALLEAGHIGQNVYLVSQALGLQCCGMGGSYDTPIEELLDIDGENESLLYTLAVGKGVL
ncbi:hypothetical protein A2419_00790 [Candidatus Adlerbacteria bacterium RIFOXYC1_FULL_48_26]|uniref:Nitroreductase domain-containing protein n=1 Tax=Candidatus Adlerbacteria bacterium RIFOXYC1_FULL_48_26 TaxID=1797247 RepID=A0A1F4Y220_9BACT|nr:MAG: hypothetical protein A2419_00790 [Candidatus Adlerbacteria bacterium RIFOXYC1_FULL_48_26]